MDNFNFNPVNGLTDQSAFPDNPGSSAEARTQIQTPLNQLRDFINDSVVPELTNIVAYGTNSNGSYIKFANGVQICWIKTTVTDQAIDQVYGTAFIGTRIWTFPNAFIDTNVTVTCGQFKWGSSASWGGVSDNTGTNANLRGYDFFSRTSGTSTQIEAMAIGKWK